MVTTTETVTADWKARAEVADAAATLADMGFSTGTALWIAVEDSGLPETIADEIQAWIERVDPKAETPAPKMLRGVAEAFRIALAFGGR